MKTKFLAIGLIAAMMVPAAVQAQPRAIERNHGVQYKPGHAQNYYDARRDARPDMRQSQRDWRSESRYQNWRAPFRYQSFRAGSAIRSTYYAPAYRLNYDSRWNVPRAGKNMTYVRHYDDLLLVNVRTGKVMQVYRNHFRWR
jgi:Ni/Co efflux regulator RcnB